jgi:hypothetical protein
MNEQRLTVLVVGAIGVGVAAGVVYAFTRKKEPAVVPPAIAPSPALEPTVATPAPPRVSLAYQSSPLHPRQGVRYRARLLASVSTLAPFSLAASDEDVGKAWAALGFASVRVFSKASELPATWPAQEVLAAPGTRWVEGTWGLATVDLTRPSAVAAMWQTRSA